MVSFAGRRGLPVGRFVDYGADGGTGDSTHDGPHRATYDSTCDGAASGTDGGAVLGKSCRSDGKAAGEQRRYEDLFHLGLSFG